MTGTWHSMAMVDRSGWDQSFVDVGTGGSCPPPPSPVGSVANGRSSVVFTADVVSESLCNGEVVNVSSRCDLLDIEHRLHDFVLGLRIDDFTNNSVASADVKSKRTSVHNEVICHRTAVSPTLTNTSSGSNIVNCVLALPADRLISVEAHQTNVTCLPTDTHDAAVKSTRFIPGSTRLDDVERLPCPRSERFSSVVSSIDQSASPLSTTTSEFYDDIFPTYENTSVTLMPIDCRFSSNISTSKSNCFQTTPPADTPSPFDLNGLQNFAWTPADFCNANGVQRNGRHSSSASDFVGSSTTGSPPPFMTPSTSGGADVCCRSSTSPFRIGGGSQSDSGCSEGGGDSSELGSMTTHFRFSVGPSPIIDDCQSAIDAISRRRNELVQPSVIRIHNGSLSSPSPLTTPTTPASSSAYSRIVGFIPSWDVELLETVYSRLQTCGFYYGRMSIDEATERLRRTPVGTFLLRDSADERYLFSISVQTCRGTTSIRVAFRSGLFRLDSSADQEHLMPTFDCVLRLISYYVGLCSTGSGSSTGRKNQSTVGAPKTGNSYVLLETSGRRDTPVLLRAPLRDRTSSLAHLCRRTIHTALNRGGAMQCAGSQLWLSTGEPERSVLVDRLHLIPSLKRYLKDYPYDL